MASQTARDVLTLSPNALNRQPMQFLSLSPTTSASYPMTPVIKSPTSTSPTTASNTTTPIIPAETKERRSSSSASSASGNGNGRRFLKLGPVHFGESYDSEGDWSENVVAE